MRKSFLTIFFAINIILCGFTLQGQTKYGVVIGIGDYPKESGWNNINGDKDVDIIVEILNKYNFHKKNIRTLKNQQATKHAIISALESTTKKSTKGDLIYIHFSGHGQLVTDVNGDELSGYDQAWIPYDAQKNYIKGKYEGENHLIDDQINELLTKLKNKIGDNGEILVIVDACHSGGSTRGDDEEYSVRGVNEQFIIPIHNNSKQAPKTTRWTTISACESFQSNYESKINGQWFGSLSYAIFANKEKLNADSYVSIFSALKHTLNDLVKYPQTPVIENGNKNNKMFVKNE